MLFLEGFHSSVEGFRPCGRPRVADCIPLASPSGQSLLVPSLRLSNANPLHWALRSGPPDSGGLCLRAGQERPAPTTAWYGGSPRPPLFLSFRRGGVPFRYFRNTFFVCVKVAGHGARLLIIPQKLEAQRSGAVPLHRANPPAQKRVREPFQALPLLGRAGFFQTVP